MLRDIEQAMATVIVADDTETITDDMAALVREAALKLDDWVPDWFTKVDVDTLFMADGTSCVLGQVFADHSGSHSTGYGWAIEPFRDKYVDPSRLFTTTENVRAERVTLDSAFGADSQLVPHWVREVNSRLLAASA